MTAEPGRAAVPSGPDAQVREAPPDNALIAWLAERHGRRFSHAALQVAMPATKTLRSPEDVARALEVFDLDSRLVQTAPHRVDPGALPCVIFRKDGSPAVLTGLSRRGRRMTVVDPVRGDLETEMTRRQATAEFAPKVLLVSKTHAAARGPANPQAQEEPDDTRSWFWRPIRESWGAWVQVLIAALCLNLLNLALPIFVMNVYDRVIPNAAFVTLWTLAIGVGIALLLEFALRGLRISVLERIGRRVDLRISSALFEQSLNARLMSRPGGAAGMANTIREFETMKDFFGSASFVAVIDLLFIGVFVAVLFFVVGPLAWVPLLAIPVVLLLAVVAQIPLRRSAAQAQELSAKRHVVLVESLLGIEAIKSLNGEPVMQRDWENAVAASARIGGRTRFWSGLATNGTQLVQQAVSVAIIVWGVYLVSQNAISVGALIAANILAGRVLAPLAAISQTIFRAHYAMRSMRALTELMSLPRERPRGVTSDLVVRHGAIRFKEVSFRYPGAPQPALNGVSFDIAAGEVVALLGRVGSGKTTTGKLMNGLLQPDSGNILIDDHGLAQYDPAELRSGIGYLTQESELFTGTLRENMVLGAPHASDEDIREALYYAGMDGFAAANPKGLQLFLGDKGSHLSGGQRQGIALARLILRKPKVLFLDEPTNAMDQQMEADVIARLQDLGQGRTTLIFCTHRMSLANIAARFIVLDQGRKVLDGPRDEVLARLRAARAEQLRG